MVTVMLRMASPVDSEQWSVVRPEVFLDPGWLSCGFVLLSTSVRQRREIFVKSVGNSKRTVEVRTRPPFSDKTVEGWGTLICGKLRAGYPAFQG